MDTKFSKCCCCIDLRTGAMILGILACIAAVVGIIDTFVLIFHPFSNPLIFWAATA